MTPLELWDLRVDGKSLFDARHDGDFCARLAGAVRLLGARHEFSRVWVAGGGAARADLAPALAQAGWPFTICPLGQFAAEPGGFALAAGAAHPLVVDVGQTAIKLMWRGGRRRIERDFARLPSAPNDDCRAELRDFIGGALVAGRRAAGAVDRLVLALPAELDDALVPAACSYPGLAGDARLVADVLARAQLDDVPALVLNDAELSAVSAQLQARASLLVLTLGYGVGGALVRHTLPPAA